MPTYHIECAASREARKASDSRVEFWASTFVHAAPVFCESCGCVRVYRNGDGSHAPCEHSISGPGGTVYGCLICNRHCS